MTRPSTNTRRPKAAPTATPDALRRARAWLRKMLTRGERWPSEGTADRREVDK
jgi:hypothetical protein